MILIKPSYEILTEINPNEMLKRIELAGRTCYKSESKITNESCKTFVKNIIKSGHHSVIEHENISVRFICDRGVTHELVRHRLAAYSQESTRYCNYKGAMTFIIPPWINVEPGEYVNYPYNLRFSRSDHVWLSSMFEASSNYDALILDGQSPQQARSVLPNSLKTEIVMTANLREWRHIFNLRCSPAAHPQMREIMLPLRAELSKLLPEVFYE